MAVVKCTSPSCGKELPDYPAGVRILDPTRETCPYCGYSFNVMRCPECRSVAMERKHCFGGDEEGRNTTELYQCPQCKTVEVV